jgi:hypothetical protein
VNLDILNVHRTIFKIDLRDRWMKFEIDSDKWRPLWIWYDPYFKRTI